MGGGGEGHAVANPAVDIQVSYQCAILKQLGCMERGGGNVCGCVGGGGKGRGAFGVQQTVTRSETRTLSLGSCAL